VRKNLLKYALLVTGLVLSASTAAQAMMFRPSPEVDPSLAVGAVTMLAGTLVVLRARRKK
jgi:hypothetical protein